MVSATLLLVLAGAPNAPSPSWASLRCSSELVKLWKELVEGGCRLPRIKSRLPLALRLLRNTPYAAKGHRFKTKLLGAFYKRHHESCVWYQPHDRQVVLPERELRCAQKLKKLETRILKKVALSAPMEAFLLDGGGGVLVQEIKRTLRGKKARSQLEILGSKHGHTLIFTDFTGEFEEAVIVSCDGESCRVDVTG